MHYLNGRCPFRKWLNSLRDVTARAKIRLRVDRLEAGNLGDFKPVGNGVFELRIDYGPGYRVYYGQVERTIVLLLCGGDKSTQEKDIVKAQEYWTDSRSRENA